MEYLSKRAQNKRATHHRILEAALCLFAQDGYEAIRVEDICTEAGIARATFFKYFPSKAALIEAFAAQLLERVDETLRGFDLDAFEMLELLRAIYIDEWRRFGSLFSRLIEKGISPESMAIEASLPALERRVARIIRQGQACHDLKPAIQPAVIAASIVAGWRKAVVEGSAREDLNRGEKDSREVLDAVFYGIAARIDLGAGAARNAGSE